MGRLENEIEKVERRWVRRALEQKDVNPGRAAKFLGISEAEFARKAKHYGFPLPQPKKLILQTRTKTAEMTVPQAVAVLEREWITEALKASGGEIQHAADLIGLHRSQFYRRMAQLSIKRPPIRARAKRQPRKRDIHGAVKDLKNKMIAKGLRESGGNVIEATYRLGLQRSTMYRMLEEFGYKEARKPSKKRRKKKTSGAKSGRLPAKKKAKKKARRRGR